MNRYIGFLLSNEREIIILLLLLFLIFKTNIIILKIIYVISFYTHFKKLLKNYKYNNKIYKHKFEILNLLLFISLLHFFCSGNILAFGIIFIISRYIFQNYLKVNDFNFFPLINDKYIILGSLFLYLRYKDYKYNDIFLIEFINHSINYIINI